ncbi:MAG: HlyD family efflux transporter periplasmic adaptor subunit [Eubacteriales bacterium]|nr:HlyD family efflux transporter periplasmic adaptor subunit [Eubacteriales bacterium]
MKKWFILLMVLCLLAVTPALASTDLTGRPIADGVVAATAFTDITAPYSGTLQSFDLESGDAVGEGDVLFTYVTGDVYAPEDGVVKAVFIAAGDDAASAMGRYGAVFGIEPTVEYRVEASTAGAANDNDNKLLHLGETLYFKTSGTNGDEGEGRVVAVNGKDYTVDVLDGDFDLNASVTLYREDSYATKTCVGKGTVTRRDPVLVSASGRAAKVYVQEGDAVKSGDLLASFVSADASPLAYGDTVVSGCEGAVKTVAVSPGQQVWKGELLCRVDLTDEIEVVADVDEVDMGTLKVGDMLPVTLDVNEGSVITGTVTQISQLGVTRQNAAYFTVHVSIPRGSALLGASASVYLPEQ